MTQGFHKEMKTRRNRPVYHYARFDKESKVMEKDDWLRSMR